MKRQEETECRAYLVLNAEDRIPGVLSHEPMHKKTGGKRIPPYAGSAPWGEAFRIARPVCLPQAGSWAPPGMQGPPLPGTPPADSLLQPGRFLESIEAVLSLAGTGGGELICHHH